MGDREVETSLKELPFSVESGVGRRDMETVCSCYVLFPEICFVMMGLNVTIDYRIRKLAKRSGNEAGDVHVIWNETILELRKFQSVFLNCMREQLSQKTFTRFRNYIFKGADFADRMYGQYLDIRNRKFMGKSPDKRKKDLAIEAKRLMEYPHDVNYQDMKREIDAFAEEQQIDHSDVRFADNDYPDIIW